MQQRCRLRCVFNKLLYLVVGIQRSVELSHYGMREKPLWYESLPLKNPSINFTQINVRSAPFHRAYLPNLISLCRGVRYDKLPRNFGRKKKLYGRSANSRTTKNRILFLALTPEYTASLPRTRQCAG